MEKNLFRGTTPSIYTTDPDDPEEGRTFIWAWTEWFERISEEPEGPVEFMPVAHSERELWPWLEQQGIFDLEELTDEYGEQVCQEFLSQVPLVPEAPELSNEEPFGEQDVNEDIEHQ